MRLREALLPNEHTKDNGTEIYGVPHAGGLGTASIGGYAGVDAIWRQLAARFKQLSV
jgi:hypothetical protein